MKLKKLYEQWKMCRGKFNQSNWKWKPEIFIDDEYFGTYIIPTMEIIPWFNIPPRYGYIFNIVWLNMFIGIGKLESYKDDGESNNV